MKKLHWSGCKHNVALWKTGCLAVVLCGLLYQPAQAAHPRPSVRLKGVNVPGLEYDINGVDTLNGAKNAVEVWGANCLRIPLNQSFWFGYNWNGWQDIAKQSSYRSKVDAIVDYCTSKNVYVILDLHWSDMGQWGQNLRQHWMPDDNSTAFWADCAARYANKWNVIFNLYNEPRVVGWDVWKWGGNVNENGVTYHTPGHQALLNTIRSKGNNWVLADGAYVSTDISGINNGYALSDSLDKTGYAMHIYPTVYPDENAWNSRITWNNPNGYWLLVGEWGTDPENSDNVGIPPQGCLKWSTDLVAWLKSNNLDYTAWGFNKDTKPSLVTDVNYAIPTTYFGQVVRNDLPGTSGTSSGAANARSGSWGVTAGVSGTPTWANLWQYATVPTYTNCTAGFWMKGSGKVTLKIWSNYWSYLLTSQEFTATSSWQYYSLPFNSGGNSSVTYNLLDSSYSSGTIYIDDCFAGNGSNGLPNAGFENGATSWNVSSPFRIVQNP